MADWGTVPEWLAAVGTVGAFIFGGILLRAELADAKARREDARRAQARKITAWMSYDEGDTPCAVVHNASDAPIYNLVATAQQTAGQAYETGHEEPNWAKLVPPGETESWPIRSDGQWSWVTIEFTDASEVHWRRDGSGRLTEMDEPAPFMGCDG